MYQSKKPLPLEHLRACVESDKSLCEFVRQAMRTVRNNQPDEILAQMVNFGGIMVEVQRQAFANGLSMTALDNFPNNVFTDMLPPVLVELLGLEHEKKKMWPKHWIEGFFATKQHFFDFVIAGLAHNKDAIHPLIACLDFAKGMVELYRQADIYGVDTTIGDNFSKCFIDMMMEKGQKDGFNFTGTGDIKSETYFPQDTEEQSKPRF